MFDKITVIGCGLIGSSLIRAINKKNCQNKLMPSTVRKKFQTI